MDEDLQVIENIRRNELYLGVVFEKNKDKCINFLRKKDTENKLNEDDLLNIFSESVYLFYKKIAIENFVLSSSISTFVTAICKMSLINALRNKERKTKKKIKIKEVVNLENLSIRAEDEINDEPYNRISRALELMRNANGICYELLTKAIYEFYSNEDLKNHFEFANMGVVTTRKNRCKNKLRTIALQLI